MSEQESAALTEAEIQELLNGRGQGIESERDRIARVAEQIKVDAYAAGIAARTPTATGDADAAGAHAGNVEVDYDRRGERLWRLAALAGWRPGNPADNDATAEQYVTEAIAATATGDDDLVERVTALAEVGVREQWPPDEWRAGLLALLAASPAPVVSRPEAGGDGAWVVGTPVRPEDERWDTAVDWVLNHGAAYDLIAPFWAYCDGLITKKELREESVSVETINRRREKAERTASLATDPEAGGDR